MQAMGNDINSLFSVQECMRQVLGEAAMWLQ